ncbi:hypothetical protein GN244_ATG00947 [Phytophthora infestans]|uniref:Uncharacterized protein n=1 Tax=Phytophthora infestans TaxID=4787 RepID=A0A833SDN0_PHYIN|nr:hypothetical protein GN244_ATG00947 [Phytophthora infestans]
MLRTVGIDPSDLDSEPRVLMGLFGATSFSRACDAELAADADDFKSLLGTLRVDRGHQFPAACALQCKLPGRLHR